MRRSSAGKHYIKMYSDHKEAEKNLIQQYYGKIRSSVDLTYDPRGLTAELGKPEERSGKSTLNFLIFHVVRRELRLAAIKLYISANMVAKFVENQL